MMTKICNGRRRKKKKNNFQHVLRGHQGKKKEAAEASETSCIIFTETENKLKVNCCLTKGSDVNV